MTIWKFSMLITAGGLCLWNFSMLATSGGLCLWNLSMLATAGELGQTSSFAFILHQPY